MPFSKRSGAYVSLTLSLTTNTLMFKSTPCVFLGYDNLRKGYRCFDQASGRIYISRHVLFDESVFPMLPKNVTGTTSGPYFFTSIGPTSHDPVLAPSRPQL